MEKGQEKRCYYCFERLNAHGQCPACHKDPNAPVPENHLAPGTVVRGRFQMGRALGQDAQGIVYLALDLKTQTTVRIRELFPRGAVQRMADGSVQVLPGGEAAFEQAMSKMRSSADTGDQQRRRVFFEWGGTGYLAQRRVSGPAPAPQAGEEDQDLSTGRITRKVLILAAVVVLVVVGGMIWLISAARTPTDVTNPTGGLTDGTWVAPTPTPLPAGAVSDPDDLDIVDPGTLDWREEEPAQDLDTQPGASQDEDDLGGWDDWEDWEDDDWTGEDWEDDDWIYDGLWTPTPTGGPPPGAPPGGHPPPGPNPCDQLPQGLQGADRGVAMAAHRTGLAPAGYPHRPL